MQRSIVPFIIPEFPFENGNVLIFLFMGLFFENIVVEAVIKRFEIDFGRKRNLPVL